MSFITVEEKTNKNCNVSKLGFHYPIIIRGDKKFREKLRYLSHNKNFGEPVRNFHYGKSYGSTPCLKVIYQRHEFENAKWYAGPKLWSKNNNLKCSEYWFVFKEEKHRNMALLILK